MKKGTKLSEIAVFEAESTSPNGVEFINISGDITFLVNCIRKAEKKEIELPEGLQAIKDKGGKYFFASVYPFPEKINGEWIHDENERSVITAKKDRFNTDAKIKAFVKACEDNKPEDWREFASGVLAAAKKKFFPKEAKKAKKVKAAKSQKTASPAKSKGLDDTPANRKRVAKAMMKSAEQTDKLAEMAEIIVTRYENWASIPANSLTVINNNCEKLGVKITVLHKMVDELTKPDESEDLNMDF